jgi:uncharacterized Zn finger protein
MNSKVIINCPHCKTNSMAEVIEYDYQIANHFDRLLKCMNCGKPVNEHIDLTKHQSYEPRTIFLRR